MGKVHVCIGLLGHWLGFTTDEQGLGFIVEEQGFE
jgi:hypothetical protein